MSALRPGCVVLAVVLLASVVSLTACAEPMNPEAGPTAAATSLRIADRTYRQADVTRFKLPKALREISGLALDDAERLYGHDDERAIIYQIDYQQGRILNRFGLRGGLAADFEGIAWLNDRLFMITSAGELFEFPAGAADAVVPYQTHTDGLNCEVEGLTRSADGNGLLAACKNRPKGKQALHIYRWQPGDTQWSAEPFIRVKRSQFDALFAESGMERPDKFQPTAITVTPERRLLLIAGPQKVLLELSAEGVPVAVARLDADVHRQSEGIAMTASGVLIIADEGDNRGSNKSRGRLAIYRPGPDNGAAQ